jgi:hypothetical protein
MKNKIPKGLDKVTTDFIKEAEKKNRLAEALIPPGSAEDGSDFLKVLGEMMQDPSKWTDLCQKIDDEVEKESQE